LLSREYAAPKVFNTIFTAFNLGVNVDAKSGVHFTNGTAKFQNNILWDFGSNGTNAPYGQNSVGLWVVSLPANSNLFVDPLITSISRTNVPTFQMNPLPQTGSPALSSPVSAPNDGFYTPVSFIGAFTNVNWASDWGYGAESCLLSGVAAGTPNFVTVTVTPPPNAVILSAARNGSNVDVSFLSQSGYLYQLQSCSSPTTGSWSDVGSPVAGTGGVLTISDTVGSGEEFFRVKAY